ncbi:MAG: hypothetical protein ACIARR_06875 [Phycisphaerales bacterium JB059]
MRAHEMTELISAAWSVAAIVLTRRRPSARAPLGEQTGGARFGLMRLSASERVRRGLPLPSERSGTSPPGIE